jgi:hypothetical protein
MPAPPASNCAETCFSQIWKQSPELKELSTVSSTEIAKNMESAWHFREFQPAFGAEEMALGQILKISFLPSINIAQQIDVADDGHSRAASGLKLLV